MHFMYIAVFEDGKNRLTQQLHSRMLVRNFLFWLYKSYLSTNTLSSMEDHYHTNVFVIL